MKNESQHKKRPYVQPTITVELIEMENGIATSSASLRPGDPYYPDQPSTQNWNDKGLAGSNDFDL